MGPVLGALASVGKELLAEKAVGLLNGKDKQTEIDEISNEVPYETSNEAPVEISNEYHSAEDDNPDINTADTEGNLETSDIPQVEAIAPEANDTESEFSAAVPGSSFLSPADYQKAKKLSNKELKKRLSKEPELLNNLLRDTLSNDDYESGSFDNKVFDFEAPDSGTTIDPILQDLSSRYPDLKYSELASNPEAFKYYTESRGKRDKRLKDSLGDSTGILQGTSLEEMVDLLGDTYLENPKKYTKESLEALIENKPEQVIEDLKMPEKAKEEATQVLDSDARNDEANNEVVEEAVDELNNNSVDSSPLNKSNLEEFIEANPEKAAEDFGDTEVEEEAKQILDDSDKRNDEVNDNEIGKFLDKKDELIDWDKVHVYEPNEDPYNKISDESDWINNPDYEPSEGADVYLHHDDDFAGPDELPATIDQIRDEDFVGPDEQLAIYNGGVPEEIYSEPVYDTSDYNFDWDYDIQTLGVSSPEEIPDAPVENKEQAKAKQRLMHWFKSKHLDQSSKPGPVDSTPADNRSERLSMAGRRAGALSIPASGSGSVSSASMGNSKENQPKSFTSNSIASKAPLPVALEDNQGREVSVNGKATTMPTSSKNGSMRSGSFGLMSKPSKSTKVGKPVGATSGGAYHTQSNGSMNSKQVSGIGQVATNGKEALIERIRTLLKKLPEEKVSQLGFSSVGNTYKGKSLEQYDGYTLQNINKQLENLIGE